LASNWSVAATGMIAPPDAAASGGAIIPVAATDQFDANRFASPPEG